MESQQAVCGGQVTPPPSPGQIGRHFDSTTEDFIRDSLNLLQLEPADRVVVRIADQRDAVQKKAFSKWINKHLDKVGRLVEDLFEDLRDGHHLISLLQVLSGHQLPRERGRLRLHMLQNVQSTLNYLRYRKIKLINIRAEDIVDGNPKLILGLIWSIILHFQISDIVSSREGRLTAREMLLQWAQTTTANYPGVCVKDLVSSWKDGLAFNAIIHRNRPDLIDWTLLTDRPVRDRLDLAFRVVERNFAVTRLLDPEDVDTAEPDEKSLLMYISSLYDVFPEPPRMIEENPALMRHQSGDLPELERLAAESDQFGTGTCRQLQLKQHALGLCKETEISLQEIDLKPQTLEPSAAEKLHRESQSRDSLSDETKLNSVEGAILREREDGQSPTVEQTLKRNEPSVPEGGRCSPAAVHFQQVQRCQSHCHSIGHRSPETCGGLMTPPSDCDAKRVDLSGPNRPEASNWPVRAAATVRFSADDSVMDGLLQPDFCLNEDGADQQMERSESADQWKLQPEKNQCVEDAEARRIPLVAGNAKNRRVRCRERSQLRKRIKDFEATRQLLPLWLSSRDQLTSVPQSFTRDAHPTPTHDPTHKEPEELPGEQLTCSARAVHLEGQCSRLLEWLDGCSRHVAAPLRVSAEDQRLRDQQQQNETTYEELMDKEPQVLALLESGRHLLAEDGGVQSLLTQVRRNWDRVHQEVANRRQRLQISMELLVKYEASQRALVSWFGRVEDRLDVVQCVPFQQSQLEKQIKQLQSVSSDVSGHGATFDTHRTIGDSLLSSCDVDKERVREQLSAMTKRRDVLDAALLQWTRTLLAISQRLVEFDQLLDEAHAAAERCEHRFATCDALDPARSALLQRLNQLLAQVVLLEKNAHLVDHYAAALEAEAASRGSDASHLRDEADRLVRRYTDLRRRLEHRCSSLEDAVQRDAQLEQLVEQVTNQLETLETQLEHSPPAGRCLQSLVRQLEETRRFLTKVEACQMQMERIADQGRNEQLEILHRRASRLEDRGKSRADVLDKDLRHMRTFRRQLQSFMRHMDEVDTKQEHFKLVSSDLDSIRQQREELDRLKQQLNESLHLMDEVNGIGQDLIRSAADGVSTCQLQSDLRQMNERWNDLQGNIGSRQRRLDAVWSHSTKFQAEVQDLLHWTTEAEGKAAVAVTAMPSDEELLRQRIDEHDLFHREILSKRPAFAHLVQVASTLEDLLGQGPAAPLNDLLGQLSCRYQALTERCQAAKHLLGHFESELRELILSHQALSSWMQHARERLSKCSGLSVRMDKLQTQVEDLVLLAEQVADQQQLVDTVANSGLRLMNYVTCQEVLQLQEKLEGNQRLYGHLTCQVGDALATAQVAVPLAAKFCRSSDHLCAWLAWAESRVQVDEAASDGASSRSSSQQADVDVLNQQLAELRLLLDSFNENAAQLGQRCPEDESWIRRVVVDYERRFDLVCEQVRLANERLQLSRERSAQVTSDLDTLLHWFREAESQMRQMDPPSSVPQLIRVQLSDHDALVNVISNRVEEVQRVLSASGRVLRQGCAGNSARLILKKSKALQEAAAVASQLCADRTGFLQQVLRLAEHLEAPQMCRWFDERSAKSESADFPANGVDNFDGRQGENDLPPVADSLHHPADGQVAQIEAVPRQSDAEEEKEDGLQVAQSDGAVNQLDSLLVALTSVLEQIECGEPVSARPDEIRVQIRDNQSLAEHLRSMEAQVEAVKAAADDFIRAAGQSDPGSQVVKVKLERLSSLWVASLAASDERDKSLDEALHVAECFWEELNESTTTLKELEGNLVGEEPAAVEPAQIEQQRNALLETRHGIEQCKHEAEFCRQTGEELAALCGQVDGSEIKKRIDEMSSAWVTVSALCAKRQAQLDEAMHQAVQYHQAFDDVMKLLENAEEQFRRMTPSRWDLETVKDHIDQLDDFKDEAYSHMLKIQALKGQADQLVGCASPTQAARVKESLAIVGRRWENLLRAVLERQRCCELALVHLMPATPFQPATMDPKSEHLADSAADQAQGRAFDAQVQDSLAWLADVEKALVACQPVGALPETACEQLGRFMPVWVQLEESQSKMAAILQRDAIYVQPAAKVDSSTIGNCRSLRQRWESALRRAVDKKMQLESALKDAVEFHDALQAFVDWLTRTETSLANPTPASRTLTAIVDQIEEHKGLQRDIGAQRERLLSLNEKGARLKQLAQKQDAVLITNLLVSVQNRWEHVLSKAAERAQALDYAYQEAKKFHDSSDELSAWLDDAERDLRSALHSAKDPDSIQQALAEHRAFQRSLASKQPTYDALLLQAKLIEEHIALETDAPALKQMVHVLTAKWRAVCRESVDLQRKLEEGLLFSGQFQDAVQAHADWFAQVDVDEMADGPVHGDLDTVAALCEQHRSFREQLTGRLVQIERAGRKADEWAATSGQGDQLAIGQQVAHLKATWRSVEQASESRATRLAQALAAAETFHKSVHMLVDWLSGVEVSLRGTGPLPESQPETTQQMALQRRLAAELAERETDKDGAIAQAHEILAKCHPDGVTVVRHWIAIIRSRWDDVATWVNQRENRLKEHLRHLEAAADLVAQLLAWLASAESALVALDAETIPDDLAVVRRLIKDHQAFMEDVARRQPDVDRICKSHQVEDQTGASQFTRSTRAKDSPGRDQLTHIGSLATGPSAAAASSGQRVSAKMNADQGLAGKSPSGQLWEQWCRVWMMAWDRLRHLQHKSTQLQQVESASRFSWDDWRRRLLGMMDEKKSRVTDLVRRMDKSGRGTITRQDFIEAILRTKMPTSRSEMNVVADLFDRNGGLVDTKEFLDALRWDWEEPGRPSEEIYDQVTRQVQHCTCPDNFTAQRVGPGLYRFGNSRKLRLVRVLRSVVMVRVGGGWVALDEFLAKNDRCRARGRTNLELREQLVQADAGCQGMSPSEAAGAKSVTSARPSQNAAIPVASTLATGPITKIREKTVAVPLPPRA